MWVLVTGGAKRLGSVICQKLAENGHSVIVHYNKSEKNAHAVVKKCRSYGVNADSIQGDFSCINNVLLFMITYSERFPQTKALINNVGDYLTASICHTSWQEWNQLFHLNLHVPFLLSQHLLPSLIREKGSLINIGVSGLLKHSAYPYSTAYMLTKESLWGLTRSLAYELAEKSVRVNMVSPGMLDISVDLESYPHKLPMLRPGTCEEVANVINFLLDPKNAYVTGQNIEVAGGLGLK